MSRKFKYILGLLITCSPFIGLFTFILYENGFKVLLTIIAFVFIIVTPIAIGTKIMVDNEY